MDGGCCPATLLPYTVDVFSQSTLKNRQSKNTSAFFFHCPSHPEISLPCSRQEASFPKTSVLPSVQDISRSARSLRVPQQGQENYKKQLKITSQVRKLLRVTHSEGECAPGEMLRAQTQPQPAGSPHGPARAPGAQLARPARGTQAAGHRTDQQPAAVPGWLTAPAPSSAGAGVAEGVRKT